VLKFFVLFGMISFFPFELTYKILKLIRDEVVERIDTIRDVFRDDDIC
jgi:hypothetical protein